MAFEALNTAAISRTLPGVAWLLASVLGAAVVAGSLSFQPDGRINLLWVWLLWAFLPAMGSGLALIMAVAGGRRPWLFRWGRGAESEFPGRRSRWRMLWQVQVWWCGVSASMTITYGLFLLFTDLSFGWSSTLITEPARVHDLTRLVAIPWGQFWPAAVPGPEVVAATQFNRINPMPADVDMAAAWWPFLLASLLVYNVLPRGLLAVMFYWRWRMLTQEKLSVVSPQPAPAAPAMEEPIPEDTLMHWQEAPCLAWETDRPDADLQMGVGSWAEDQAALDALLAAHPRRLSWWVEAERTPVAELADCVAQALRQGVTEQGLYVKTSAATDRHRHVASWRAFARQHNLVWLT